MSSYYLCETCANGRPCPKNIWRWNEKVDCSVHGIVWMQVAYDRQKRLSDTCGRYERKEVDRER